MMKVEITKGGPIFKEYTKKDMKKDLILDLIHYAEEYQKLKWWQIIKQNILIDRIGFKSKQLLALTLKEDLPT